MRAADRIVSAHHSQIFMALVVAWWMWEAAAAGSGGVVGSSNSSARSMGCAGVVGVTSAALPSW